MIGWRFPTMMLSGCAAPAGSQQRVAILQPCLGSRDQTRSDDPELASREALHASSSFACSFLVFPLGLLWRQQGPFPPERCPRHFSAPCMRGQESKNMIPVRTRLPYPSTPCDIVRRDVFWAVASKEPMPVPCSVSPLAGFPRLMAPGPMGHGSLDLLRLSPVAATPPSVSSAAH